jgi:hypothetical protein
MEDDDDLLLFFQKQNLKKRYKGRTALHTRTSILGVRPILGTVPIIRAIPCKVAWHTTLPTFDNLARHRVESTTDRYCDPWVVDC